MGGDQISLDFYSSHFSRNLTEMHPVVRQQKGGKNFDCPQIFPQLLPLIHIKITFKRELMAI